MLLTEDTEKERAARLAALEEGEMLLESPSPSSSVPACPLSALPQLQSRGAWPQKSPALSSGIACAPLQRCPSQNSEVHMRAEVIAKSDCGMSPGCLCPSSEPPIPL